MASSDPSPSFIFFTDFDGTITLRDSNDFLADTLGCGESRRRELGDDVLHRGRPSRETFSEMLESVRRPWSECVAYLAAHAEMDPGFRDFYAWCRRSSIPVVVLSAGMRPMIETQLATFLGADEMRDLTIVSNDVEPKEGMDIEDPGGWKIAFRDDSPSGHDKATEIRKYSTLPLNQRPILFYAGDGVSDLSAAKEADLLFARAGKDLVTYCEKGNVPFVTFDDFSSILRTVQAIVSGKTTCKAESKGRISSK